MSEILSCAVSVASECLVGLVGPHCGYVFFTDRKVRQLEGELDELVNSGLMVGHDVEEARKNMKLIEPGVEKWVEDEQIVANKARSVLDGRAQKTCVCGWLPNPKARYCLGKDASETVKEIRNLTERKNIWKKVYYENPPPGIVHVAPEGNSSAGGEGDNIQEHIARGQSKNAPPGLVSSAADLNSSVADGGDIITGSRASIFREIMEALGDDKLKVIGVYGPGGVGKTTLLEEVEKKLRKDERPFHMIVKAKVSQNQDLAKIRYDIAYALSLNLKDEPSEEGKKDLLSKRLQRDPNENVLIILDDLWDELDLKAVGLPSGEGSKGCKLLLTSRYNNVLLEKMGADRTFPLKGLEDAEAVRLFEKTVRDRLKDEEELKPIAAQVATKLAGLPLLINSVARFLKNSKVGAWRNAAKKLDAKEIETIVQLSYDHLKGNDTKALFLLCGLIGGTIKVQTLLVLGKGLGLFEGFEETIQDSRDRLDTMLSELRSACLLLDGGDDKKNVTIHDLYSEVVVSTPFRDQNSLIIYDNCGTWPKEKLDECRACLVDVGNDRLVELMPHQFPQAKILMLSGKNDMGDYSKKYFTDMKDLRALCLCSRSVTSLPSPIEILGNLQSLIINCDVEDVAILGDLTALQVLSFGGNTISRLPKKFRKLKNLRSLNIGHTSSLVIESGVLEGLINLEELHMKGGDQQWMEEDGTSSSRYGARLAELKSLTKLTSLEIYVSPHSLLLEDDDLPVGKLIRFYINIGNPRGRKFKGLNTMKLNLDECGNVLSRDWVQKTLQITEHLHLIRLSEFKESAHELCMPGFRKLKHLDIDDSPSIKYIANSSRGLLLTAFTKLESLFLKRLINLEKISAGVIAPECFSKLKAVRIRHCNRLKYLWCLSEIKSLVRLEEIEVWGCNSMRALIRDDEGEDIVAADPMAELPNLRRLTLDRLPNMTSFCAETETTSEGTPIQVSFPRLESLVMVGFFDLEKVLYSQLPLQYTNLKSIKMRESKSTSSILKSDWILKLPNLESLEIINCRSTKVVFDLEELKVSGHVEILPQLTKLTLSKLPDLQHVWKHDVKLHGLSAFQNLKELKVWDTGLAFLFPISLAKCLREIRDIKVTDCQNMEALIVDEEGRDEGTYDIIEFPKLEQLRIRQCPTKKFFACPSGKRELVTTTSYSQDAYSDSFFDRKVSLPNLKELALTKGSFKRIWHNQLPRSSFCELATLTLYDCSELITVFPSVVIGRLHNLKEVGVLRCPSLESLFDYETLDANTEQKRVLLPKLERVAVDNCLSLKSLFDCGSLDPNTKNTRVLLPKLEGVFVKSCPSLESVFDCGSLDSNMEQTIVLLPRLEVVTVDGAEKLRHVVKGNSQTVLDLPRLTMVNCEQTKKVVPKEENSRSKGVVMSFPSLAHITILRCPNFGAFNLSPTSIDMKLDKTAEENDESPQPLFNEMVELPNARSLQIEGDQCKELWNNQIHWNFFY